MDVFQACREFFYKPFFFKEDSYLKLKKTVPKLIDSLFMDVNRPLVFYFHLV